MGLRPAMTLRCTVAMVKPVKAGEGVSYGHTWIAERDTNVALLPIGYADGVYRTLGGRIDVLINGRLRRERRPDLHGPVRRRPRPRARPTSPRVTRRFCSAPAGPASRPPRTGPICSAPSTTRSSPARAAGSCGPTGRLTPGPVTQERRRSPRAKPTNASPQRREERRTAGPQGRQPGPRHRQEGRAAGRGRRAQRGRHRRRSVGRSDVAAQEVHRRCLRR